MRKSFILLFGVLFLLSSCAYHNGLTANANINTTEVVLSKNNYKIIERVQGEASVTYIFGLGGLKRAGLLAEARADMLANSNLIGNSRAIINESVEVKASLFPIIRKRTVTVSGFIIEFTE